MNATAYGHLASQFRLLRHYTSDVSNPNLIRSNYVWFGSTFHSVAKYGAYVWQAASRHYRSDGTRANVSHFPCDKFGNRKKCGQHATGNTKSILCIAFYLRLIEWNARTCYGRIMLLFNLSMRFHPTIWRPSQLGKNARNGKFCYFRVRAKNMKAQRGCCTKVYQQIILVTSPIVRRRQCHSDIFRAHTMTHFCSKFSEMYLHISSSYIWIFIIPCKYICCIWILKLLPSPLWTIYQNALNTTHLERENWTERVARELMSNYLAEQLEHNAHAKQKQTALYLWLWMRECAFTEVTAGGVPLVIVS